MIPVWQSLSASQSIKHRLKIRKLLPTKGGVNLKHNFVQILAHQLA
jgi:hypothetical protein